MGSIRDRMWKRFLEDRQDGDEDCDVDTARDHSEEVPDGAE